jgi:hypothetical protein
VRGNRDLQKEMQNYLISNIHLKDRESIQYTMSTYTSYIAAKVCSKIDFKDLPKYLNDERLKVRQLVRWRLERGI